MCEQKIYIFPVMQFLTKFCKFLQMPDVVSEAATLSAAQMEDLMEDDLHTVNSDPMLSSPHVPSPGHSLIEDMDMMV
jgi:hypothetical protein